MGDMRLLWYWVLLGMFWGIKMGSGRFVKVGEIFNGSWGIWEEFKLFMLNVNCLNFIYSLFGFGVINFKDEFIFDFKFI